MVQPKSTRNAMDITAFTDAHLGQRTLFPQIQGSQARSNAQTFKLNPKELRKRPSALQQDDQSRHSSISGIDNTIMDAAKVQELIGDQTPQRTLSMNSRGSVASPDKAPKHQPKYQHGRNVVTGRTEDPQDTLSDIVAEMQGQQDQDDHATDDDDKFDDSQDSDQGNIEQSIEPPSSPLLQNRLSKTAQSGTNHKRGSRAHHSKASRHQSQLGIDKNAGVSHQPEIRNESIPTSQSAFVFGKHVPVAQKAFGASRYETTLAEDARHLKTSTNGDLADLASGIEQFDNASFYALSKPRRSRHVASADAKDKATSKKRQHNQARDIRVTEHARPRSASPQDIRYDDGIVDIAELDYDLEKLSNMPFKQLAEESFDHMTRSIGDKKALEDHLARGQHLNPEDQRRLFDELAMSDWEAAGDWFLSQFGQLMQDIVAARKLKREMAGGYEAKIAQRQYAVDAREEHIKGALKDMKSGGKGILRNEVTRATAAEMAEANESNLLE